jgi:hypothetical protein
LPVGIFELSQAFEALLRKLFETFRFKVRYNRITDSLVLELTFGARDLESIADPVYPSGTCS